jgi:hypothetical protein
MPKKNYDTKGDFWLDKLTPLRKLNSWLDEAPEAVTYIAIFVGLALAGSIFFPAVNDTIQIFGKYISPVYSKITK